MKPTSAINRAAAAVISALLLCGCGAKKPPPPEAGEQAPLPTRAEEIRRRIAAEEGLGPYRVGVIIEGDRVRLVGTADRPADIARIRAAAEDAAGGTKVENSMTESRSSADEEVRQRVAAALAQEKRSEVKDLTIDVTAGTVTLSGTAPDHCVIDHLLSRTLAVKGVRDIKSALTIDGRPYSSAGACRRHIGDSIRAGLRFPK